MVKKINTKLIFWIIILFALFIRIWGINKVPVSLFGDEIDVGYQAYSVLKTGRDYSGNFLPLQFKSHTEYRAPLYLYSAVPTVGLFGVTPWGVRLPAAIFGLFGVLGMYFLIKEISKNENISLLSSFLLAISPWHIHYSRAGFEVTLLLALYIWGIYFFLKGLKKSVYFIPSAIFLSLTPWAYSTAKLYLPLTAFFLFIVYFKEIFNKHNKIYLTLAVLLAICINLPYVWSNIYGGGADRFNILSIFKDIEMEGKVGEKRLEDLNLSPITKTLYLDRLFHNKYVYWGTKFSTNYIRSFSSEFLILSGDGNPRHNSSGVGELYKIEGLLLLIGIYLLLKANLGGKEKSFLIFWLLTAPIPSALTQDGANHATRLILLLPPLLITISYGIYGAYQNLLKYKYPFLVLVIISYFLSFISYQHFYWIHYSLDTEGGWQNGWNQVIMTAQEYERSGKKVIISSFRSPAVDYYIALSQYSPDKFQKNGYGVPTELGRFGMVKKIDNIYFPDTGVGFSLYEISSTLDENTIYIAPFEEFKLDLIEDPKRIPKDIKLVNTVKYLSGKPAFYFITKKAIDTN